MLSILRKTRGSMARSGGSSPADRYGVVDDDLTAWEIVSASQSDDEDLFSFDGEDDDTSDEDDVISDVPESKPDEEEEVEDEARDLGTLDVVMAIQSLSVSPPMMFPVEVTRVRMYRDDRSEHDEYDVHHDDDDDDDDDMDDDDDDGVDDELVPWKLKGRFGKQRIKKLGKRGGSKPNKSKRMPYYYKAAGCV